MWSQPPLQAARKLVLVVEDESLIAEYVGVFLREDGYEALSALDAEEGWNLFRRERHRICAVLTDVVMPGTWNGLELARRVRTAAPQMPLILTTGHDLLPAVSNLRCALLPKPFGAAALRSAFRQANELVT
ncbi:MAG: response regulator [Verrucomicrobia bacterium]|nr:response regulator [Verrucomicrobiota bacterium]